MIFSAPNNLVGLFLVNRVPFKYVPCACTRSEAVRVDFDNQNKSTVHRCGGHAATGLVAYRVQVNNINVSSCIVDYGRVVT